MVVYNVTTNEFQSRMPQKNAKINNTSQYERSTISSLNTQEPKVDHQRVVNSLFPLFENETNLTPENSGIFVKLYQSMSVLAKEGKLNKMKERMILKLENWLRENIEDEQILQKVGISRTFIDLGELSSEEIYLPNNSDGEGH